MKLVWILSVLLLVHIAAARRNRGGGSGRGGGKGLKELVCGNMTPEDPEFTDVVEHAKKRLCKNMRPSSGNQTPGNGTMNQPLRKCFCEHMTSPEEMGDGAADMVNRLKEVKDCAFGNMTSLGEMGDGAVSETMKQRLKDCFCRNMTSPEEMGDGAADMKQRLKECVFGNMTPSEGTEDGSSGSRRRRWAQLYETDIWERPPFKTSSHQGYEVREYEPRKWVCSKSSGRQGDPSSKALFWNLFAYTQGNNNQDKLIEMTVPITTKHDGSETTMCFFLPNDLQESPPEPSGPGVFIEDQPLMTVAVRRFFGPSSKGMSGSGPLNMDPNWDIQKEKLRNSLDDEAIKFLDQPFYKASYDSPFMSLPRYELWLPQA